MTLLFVHALTVTDTAGQTLLDRVSLHLDEGQVLGLAGGRGAGKTLLCRALAGDLPAGLAIAGGRILLGNRDLAADRALNDGVVAFGFDGRPLRAPLVALYDEPARPPPPPAPGTAAIVTGRAPDALADGVGEIAVLCAGRLVERGPGAALCASPRHPYTEALIADAVDAGDGHAAGAGCPFRPACAHALPTCADATMGLQMVNAERTTACIRWRALWGFR